MTDIYEETESYAPRYDNYHNYETDYDDEFYEEYETYPDEELDYYEDEAQDSGSHVATGKRRVVYLILILLLILLVVGVVIFGVIPYVDMMTHPIVPSLPPAVQT